MSDMRGNPISFSYKENELAEKVKKLESENARLRAALEFYANLKNWQLVSLNMLPTMSVKKDLELTDKYEDTHCYQGGKIAREALSGKGKGGG